MKLICSPITLVVSWNLSVTLADVHMCLSLPDVPLLYLCPLTADRCLLYLY